MATDESRSCAGESAIIVCFPAFIGWFRLGPTVWPLPFLRTPHDALWAPSVSAPVLTTKPGPITWPHISVFMGRQMSRSPTAPSLAVMETQEAEPGFVLLMVLVDGSG